jgi:preprotein translocase subunit SecD
MLQFTRIQVTAILLTVLVICGFAIPNFVSDESVRAWPDWAQRRITLAPELGGGQSLLFEVDRNYLREDLTLSLFTEVRSAVHDARINLANPVVLRGGSVEVRPLAADFEAALAKLRVLCRPFIGICFVEGTDSRGGLIRVTPSEASVSEYFPPMVDKAIKMIRDRLFGLPGTVEREGSRIRVQLPWPTGEALERRPLLSAGSRTHFIDGDNTARSRKSS